MLNFQKLNLNPLIISALEKKGYTDPTPIQEQAIPHLLEGKDLLGIAQTGTGKTAAFSLPILDRLSKSQNPLSPNHIRTLILTPTRELATQIGENIELYGKDLNIKHAVIFGGVSEVNQIKALKNGVDIVIATPGRLLDLTNQGHIRFSQIEIFVLDEADRMLDLGFINDVKRIVAKLPEKRQSLLFSATMPDTISRLVNSILRDPVRVEVTPQSTTVERINQKVYLVAKSNKAALLLDVVTKQDVVAALVFCRTKHGADKVLNYLKEYGVSVSAIHGDKSQTNREKALKDLRDGKIKVLIATDIAARGIDVSSISHVINYDIPLDPESYVHRIGRTARAGREGVAISFCDISENLQLRAIERVIAMKIPVDNSHPFFGKAQVDDGSQGRMLSRGTGVKKVSNDGATEEASSKQNPARKHGSLLNRDRTRVAEISNSDSAQELNSPAAKEDSDRRNVRSAVNKDRMEHSRSEPLHARSSKKQPFARSQNSKSPRPHRDRFSSNKEVTAPKSKDSLAKKLLRTLSFGVFGKKSDERKPRDHEARGDSRASSKRREPRDSFRRDTRSEEKNARGEGRDHSRSDSRGNSKKSFRGKRNDSPHSKNRSKPLGNNPKSFS